MYLALGVNIDGHKELLGMWIAKTEGAKFWLNVITELQNRGVKDIFITCVDGAYFYQDWKDQISWYAQTAADGLYLIPDNLEKTIISGFDVGLYANLYWGFSARTSFTYLDARDLSLGASDELMPYKPRHKFTGGLGWAYFDWLRLYADIRHRSEIEEAIIYDTDLPEAYTLYNASATGILPWDIEVTFKVNNIRNTQYEEMAHYRMPGRSYGLTVSWRK